MGSAGLTGAIAILVAQIAATLDFLVIAQLAAGAAWGGVLASATAAALAIGESNRQGRIVGLMWSALALATFTRMTAVAAGMHLDPVYGDLLFWIPALCWFVAGAALLSFALLRPRPATAAQ
jgi:hypothetical protein